MGDPARRPGDGPSPNAAAERLDRSDLSDVEGTSTRVVLYRWNVVSGVSIGMDSQGAESSRNGGYGEIRERGERAPRPRRTGQSSCAGPLGVGMPVDSIIQIFLLSFQDSGDEEPGFIF